MNGPRRKRLGAVLVFAIAVLIVLVFFAAGNAQDGNVGPAWLLAIAALAPSALAYYCLYRLEG